jgi:hypothetical protein
MAVLIDGIKFARTEIFSFELSIKFTFAIQIFPQMRLT